MRGGYLSLWVFSKNISTKNYLGWVPQINAMMLLYNLYQVKLIEKGSNTCNLKNVVRGFHQDNGNVKKYILKFYMENSDGNPKMH